MCPDLNNKQTGVTLLVRKKSRIYSVLHYFKPYHVPAVDVSQVHHNIHLRSPELDLPLPGCEGRQRHHQKEGPVKLVLMEQVIEEADCLDGFAQTHLICQDTTVSSGKAEEYK